MLYHWKLLHKSVVFRLLSISIQFNWKLFSINFICSEIRKLCLGCTLWCISGNVRLVWEAWSLICQTCLHGGKRDLPNTGWCCREAEISVLNLQSWWARRWTAVNVCTREFREAGKTVQSFCANKIILQRVMINKPTIKLTLGTCGLSERKFYFTKFSE